MKILVCGSRHFEDSHRLYAELDLVNSEKGITEIVSGGARGADHLAERYAENLGVPCTVFPANWELYGKRAGPIRNAQMLKEGKPDLVIAFLAPNSRGTKNMIEQTEKAGVPFKVIDI